MKSNIRMDKFHRALVREVFDRPPNEQEALYLMLLLHACGIRLSDQANVERGVKGFEGITSRHAAELVASHFDRGEPASYAYWYNKWNGDWAGYGILEDPPPDLIAPLRQMRERIESHPWIERLEDDHWEILDVLT